MAIGDSAFFGYEAFVSLDLESAFGTKTDGHSFLEFNSESMKVDIERKNLEVITTGRNYRKRVSLNKTVGGSIEGPANVANDAFMYIVRCALGGTVSSTQVAATNAYAHVLYEGDMENTKSSAGASDVKSFCMQIRKGAQGAGSGTTWDFVGCRVNNLTINSEQGDLVYFNAEIIGKGGSITTSTPTASYADAVPLNFSGVKVEMGISIGAALTERYFQSFELSVNNNLAGDAIARRLGSDELQILPPGMRDITLKLTQRFDTTTAYSEWLADTTTAIQITLSGPSCPAAGESSYTMIIKLPDCYLESTPLPEIGGPEVVSQELNYRCIMQNTTTGYGIQINANNLTTGYDA
jgi:hypothetical protein